MLRARAMSMWWTARQSRSTSWEYQSSSVRISIEEYTAARMAIMAKGAMAKRSLRRSLRFAKMPIFLRALLGCLCASSRDSSVNFLTPEASYALTLVLPAPPPLPLAEVLFRDSRTSTPLHRQHIHLSLLQNADHQLNGKALPHGKSPFIGARFRRRLTLNMHQKMWSQSLLNVTELFTKESMGGYRRCGIAPRKLRQLQAGFRDR